MKVGKPNSKSRKLNEFFPNSSSSCVFSLHLNIFSRDNVIHFISKTNWYGKCRLFSFIIIKLYVITLYYLKIQFSTYSIFFSLYLAFIKPKICVVSVLSVTQNTLDLLLWNLAKVLQNRLRMPHFALWNAWKLLE